jgi:hypothetical protein
MENWYERRGVVDVTKSNHAILRPLGLFYGRNLENFEEVG